MAILQDKNTNSSHVRMESDNYKVHDVSPGVQPHNVMHTYMAEPYGVRRSSNDVNSLLLRHSDVTAVGVPRLTGVTSGVNNERDESDSDSDPYIFRDSHLRQATSSGDVNDSGVDEVIVPNQPETTCNQNNLHVPRMLGMGVEHCYSVSGGSGWLTLICACLVFSLHFTRVGQ